MIVLILEQIHHNYLQDSVKYSSKQTQIVYKYYIPIDYLAAVVVTVFLCVLQTKELDTNICDYRIPNLQQKMGTFDMYDLRLPYKNQTAGPRSIIARVGPPIEGKTPKKQSHHQGLIVNHDFQLPLTSRSAPLRSVLAGRLRRIPSRS